MFRPLAAFIGLRYSASKRRNGFIAFISASSTIGIALGVMVLIIGLSAMNGFEYELKNRILSVVANGELEAVDEPISQWQDRLDKIAQHEEVVSAAPYIKINGLLQKNTELKALQIRAIDPIAERGVSSVANYINKGSWDSLAIDKNNIVIGRGIARELDIDIGDRVTVLVSQTDKQAFKAPQRFSFTVSGIIALSGQLDNSLAYMPLSAAQRLQQRSDTIDGISIKVTDLFSANRIVGDAGRLINHYVYLRSWMTTQGYFYQDIQMVKSLMYVILILVIAVACFNIVTTLIMAVDDKRADIAILKTMGASNGLLRLIFIVHGGFNGLLGVFSGTLLGILISENLTAIIQFIEHLMGRTLLSGDIYFINFLPSQVQLVDILVVASAALTMSVVATIYPANKACQIEPARELGNK